MEEEKKELSLGEKIKQSKFGVWCKEHSGEIITVFGGVCTVAGAVISLCTKKYEENDYVYTTSADGDVYRLKAKRMPTSLSSINPDEE